MTSRDATSPSPSRVLWICDRFSVEQLMRALLLADTIRFPFSEPTSNPALDACVERGRVEFFPRGSEDRWSKIVEGKQDEILEWSAYFAEKMCRAFAAGRAEIETHEAGHRIAWAWDDGSGMFPDKLYPRGGLFTSPRFDMQRWDRLERDLASDSFGASAAEAAFALNAAPDRAKDKLLIDAAMSDLAEQAEPHSRLGLLAQDAARLTWLVGTMRSGVAFEPLQPTAAGAVLAVMLGAPSDRMRLEAIPIERFLDLGEQMAEARRAFSRHLARWSDTLATIPEGADRDRRLAALRRDEIIPAVEDFNGKAGVAARAFLGSVSSSDIGKMLLAGIAVASALTAGVALGSPEVGALAGVGATSVVKTVQDWVLNRHARQCSWTAFASALSDEVGAWTRQR